MSAAGYVQLLIPLIVGIAAIMAYHGHVGREGCVGIDLGTTFSVVAVRRVDSDEVVAIPDWETGASTVPSVVAFGVSPPVAGGPARGALHTHPRSTLYNAKRFIGRPFTDPITAAEAPLHPFGIVSGPMMPPPPGAVVGNAAQQAKARRRWRERAAAGPEYAWFRTTGAAGVAGDVNPRTVGTHVLRRLQASVAAALGHDVARQAVMAHPVEFLPHQLEETRLAFLAAGYNVVRMIDEPTAAGIEVLSVLYLPLHFTRIMLTI
jgi:molecular chaperone DnaK (HSP70)